MLGLTVTARILDPELGASQSGIRAWSYSTQERNRLREYLYKYELISSS